MHKNLDFQGGQASYRAGRWKGSPVGCRCLPHVPPRIIMKALPTDKFGVAAPLGLCAVLTAIQGPLFPRIFSGVSSMARRFVAHCFALAALGLFAPALQAQDHLLDDLYGRGVHAYFSHRYPEANDLLSQAITSGSKDARAYYFRALAQNR